MKTITGTWQTPQGTAIANGILRLKLSGDAVVTGTSQIAPNDIVITLDANGAIPSATQIYANDELTPSGTIYYVSVTTSAGAQVYGTEQWSISGSSPINLNNVTPTTLGVSYPSPITSIALTMPGEFSVSGSPLTTPGTITVTKANESANTVWSGPTSGGAASPTFRALVDADVAGVTHLRTNLTIPAVTDTIVGKATTDTLTNKTIDGSTNTFVKLLPAPTVLVLGSNTAITPLSQMNSLMSQALTMPSSGGPFRVLVSYNINVVAGGAASTVISAMNDGTTTFAGAGAVLSTSAIGGLNACAMSPNTYANGAGVTFTVKIGASATTTANVAAPWTGGQSTTLTLTVVPAA